MMEKVTYSDLAYRQVPYMSQWGKNQQDILFCSTSLPAALHLLSLKTKVPIKTWLSVKALIYSYYVSEITR